MSDLSPSFPDISAYPDGVLDARLAALAQYNILDTPPEPEFDDLVLLARKVCETPVALVSLVERDRQWFKAKAGFAPCQTSISQSVCAYALKEDDLLVIPDLTLDPRTKANTLVTEEPFIRFYAGAVLRTPEGVALGSLCVIDTKPRPHGLLPDQAEALLALGRQTMALMAMRRAVEQRVDALVQERQARISSLAQARALQADGERLRLDEARSRLAHQAGGVGTFDIEIASDLCFVSEEFCRIFGLPAKTAYPSCEIQDLIFESDKQAGSTLENRADGTAAHDTEYRIRRYHDGAVRWIGRRSLFHADAEGTLIRMIGVVQDITERKRVEARRNAQIHLGDDLRGASAVTEVVKAMGRTLGTTLDLDRAGYCVIDLAAETLTAEDDWTRPGSDKSVLPPIAGRHPLKQFERTIARLELGGPIVIANVPAAYWMAADAGWYEAVGTKAKITVPLTEHGNLVGLVFAHSSTPRTWTADEVDFVQAVADRGFATIAKINAEAQQHLLNQELSHRLKNTLSMVQAIAGQTLRGAADKEAVKAFEERIVALSRAHDVLLQQSWAAARIDTVVESVMSLHGHGDQIHMAGPNLTLGPKATLSLSMLLHELATNAIKYGALSRDGGRVAVAWRVEDQGQGAELMMSWSERGGPPASKPTRRGFGTRLISMGLVGTGKAALDYGEAGLGAEFRAPVGKLAEN